MYFSLATIIAVVPFLVSATPLAQSPRVTIPISKRTNLHRDDGTVDVEALKRSIDTLNAKISRGFDTYERNTGKRHPSRAHNDKRAIGNVALTGYQERLVDNQDHLWYGDVSVGTPPVSYTAVFDLGSSDFFLPSPSCGSTCSGHKQYNPSSSSTSKSLNKSLSVRHGDGFVKVNLYTDTVKIGGLTATKQTLGAATEYSPVFQSPKFPADGLMGLGFQSISVYNAHPLIRTLASQGQMNSPVFAFKLAEGGSELSIGGLDPDAYSGTPTYTDVTQEGYWQISFDSLTVDSSRVVSPTAAIVEPSMNVIIGSTAGVKDFYAKIPGSKPIFAFGNGYYAFPCAASPGVVAFTIGGKSLPMSSTSLNLGPVFEGSKDCVGSIIANDDLAGDFWILGDAFMKNYYTIFDYGNSKVGFADLK